MKNYLIGIDIGTQGVKASLFDFDGNLISGSFEQSNLISPHPGVVEQKTEEIYQSVLNTIKCVIDKSGVDATRVCAIGIDGQMAGIIGIDRDWNALTLYDSWLDTRCDKYIELMKQQAGDEIVKTTGCPVTCAHGPKVLWWKYERPEVYKKIYKFVQPTTFVAGKLTGLNGEKAYIDYTHLHFSGFGDIQKLNWSDDLLRKFDVEQDKMPAIVDPWTIVGYVTNEAAEKCRLVSGIPVVAGCGDQAATSLGAGVTRKGMIFDVAGTASVFSCCVDKYSPDVKNKTLVYARSVIKDLWIPLAYISGGGLCIRWFRDNFSSENSQISYTELDNEAEFVLPGSEGLIFMPHFGGRTCPNDTSIKGAWLGLNWIHKRKHLYRSIMESIAYEYSYYLKILKSMINDETFSMVVSTGGGSKSRLFNSIKADVLGIPYTNLENSEAATLGSAVVAGYGVGVYKDIVSTIDGMTTQGNIIQPDFKNHEIYKRYSDIYSRIFDTIGNTFKEINSIM